MPNPYLVHQATLRIVQLTLGTRSIRHFLVLVLVTAALTACGGGGSSGPTLESIAITPNPALVGISASTNLSTQLTATGTYSDGTTENVTSGAIWTSSAPTIATIGPTTGVATAVTPGATTIKAAIGMISAIAPLSVVTGVWEPTDSMTTARADHTATLLPNGTVLVAGGSPGGGDYLSSAEIYNPVAGTWAATGGLTTSRANQTATLLQNGTVLVAGGLGAGNDMSVSLASAEIYNPATGTWTPTGSLTTPRYGHTATLLPNGTVLVAGGNLGAAFSAEIYDPATGTWTPTGNLTTPREGHTATLLPNGTVLVAGGLGGTGGTTSAELYDPATGTWTPTASMATGRSSHTATLLSDGIVLVAGGYGASVDVDYMAPLASAELYNPATGTWTPTGSLTTIFVSQTATLLPDGTVLVAGGGYSAPNGFSSLANANLYDPVAGTWTLTGSFPTGRSQHTATLLPNGTVLVAAGYVYNQASATALIYY